MRHITIERFDQGRYPNEELVAQARQRLAKRCGIPVATILAEIAQRLPSGSAPRSLPQGTMENEDGKRADDLSDDEYLRHKRTPARKGGQGRG